jgi:hypothetical protein
MGIGEPRSFVTSVTKGLRGGAPTAAQDNDFRHSTILPGGNRERPAVGG